MKFNGRRWEPKMRCGLSFFCFCNDLNKFFAGWQWGGARRRICGMSTIFLCVKLCASGEGPGGLLLHGQWNMQMLLCALSELSCPPPPSSVSSTSRQTEFFHCRETTVNEWEGGGGAAALQQETRNALLRWWSPPFEYFTAPNSWLECASSFYANRLWLCWKAVKVSHQVPPVGLGRFKRVQHHVTIRHHVTWFLQFISAV